MPNNFSPKQHYIILYINSLLIHRAGPFDDGPFPPLFACRLPHKEVEAVANTCTPTPAHLLIRADTSTSVSSRFLGARKHDRLYAMHRIYHLRRALPSPNAAIKRLPLTESIRDWARDRIIGPTAAQHAVPPRNTAGTPLYIDTAK